MIQVLPENGQMPRPIGLLGQAGNMDKNMSTDNRRLEVHELAERRLLPINEINLLVMDGKLRYYLFGFGRVRFRWAEVFEDIQHFARRGNPQHE
jgi:hypothetical protein